MPKNNPQHVSQPEVAYSPMQLDVRIHRIQPTGHVRATASMTMNGCFAVRNIKVMDGSKGIYVAMPSYAVQSSGEYKEHCFPVTKEFREQIHGAVLNAYHQTLSVSHESALQNQPQPDNEPVTTPFDEDMDAPEPEQGLGSVTM